jgi:hypothetical protein
VNDNTLFGGSFINTIPCGEFSVVMIATFGGAAETGIAVIGEGFSAVTAAEASGAFCSCGIWCFRLLAGRRGREAEGFRLRRVIDPRFGLSDRSGFITDCLRGWVIGSVGGFSR